MRTLKYGLEEGKRAAFSFGAEYQANNCECKSDYLNDAACYFEAGIEKYNQLEPNIKAVLMEEFKRGIKAEKEAQKCKH